MKGIFKPEELPEGEKIYLKKDFLGWRVVEPIKNEDGSYNWFNLILGGKKGLFLLIILIIVLGVFYLGITELYGNLLQVSNNPCAFCTSCQDHCNAIISNVTSKTPMNFSFQLSTP